MTAHAYTEDQLVEQPAIGLFAELSWQVANAEEEIFATPSPQPSPTGRGWPEGTGEGCAALGRETPAEVVLESRLRVALSTLNPNLPAEAFDAAVVELTRDRSAMSPAAANREVWQLLREGVKVSVADTGGGSTPHPSPLPGRGGEGGRKTNRGGQRPERLRVVDWENPANNDFLLVSQMTVTGPLYTCRPDLIGFVNGLPLVVIELKKPGVPARQAFDENLTSYKHAQNGIPALFWFNMAREKEGGSHEMLSRRN